MKRKSNIYFFLFSFLLLSLFKEIQAQYQQLDSLEGFHLKVHFSKGEQERARQLAQLSHNAMAYTHQLLLFKPQVTLLVLSPADWPQYTTFPVYGMPHYANEETLIVAAEDNVFWKSFIPPLEQLPAALASQIKQAYQKKGTLTMQPFFDLLALHELGHAFHKQGGLQMQRKWLGELFCNLLLHTYIAENEPGLLPALTAFPNMVVAGGTNGYSFTTLQQFEKNYEEIATRHPKNYGWYQSRLHVAAREIYDAGGKEVLQKLWAALQSKNEKDDKELAAELHNMVHPSMASVMQNW